MRPRRHAALLLTFLFSAEWCGQGELQAQTDRNAEEVTRLLFVFDASNSMNAYWGRRRKWDVLRELLKPPSVDSLYGRKTSRSDCASMATARSTRSRATGLDDTELVVPISKGGNLLIQQELKKLRAQGTTPIARSLLRAADDFAKKTGPGECHRPHHRRHRSL